MTDELTAPVKLPFLSKLLEQSCDAVSPVPDFSPGCLQMHPSSTGYGLSDCRAGQLAACHTHTCKSSAEVGVCLPGGMQKGNTPGGKGDLFFHLTLSFLLLAVALAPVQLAGAQETPPVCPAKGLLMV